MSTRANAYWTHDASIFVSTAKVNLPRDRRPLPRDRGFWAANSYGEIVRVQFMGETTDNVPIAMFGSLDADDCYTGHPLIWASEITDWDDNLDALAARVSATPGEPAWQRINALFARHGVTPPPTRLRDELVTHLLAYDREECAARVAWSGDLTKSAAPTPNCPTPSTTTPSAREGWRGLRGIDWAALLLIAFTVIGAVGAVATMHATAQVLGGDAKALVDQLLDEIRALHTIALAADAAPAGGNH